MREARVALGQGYVTVGRNIRRVIINTFGLGYVMSGHSRMCKCST